MCRNSIRILNLLGPEGALEKVQRIDSQWEMQPRACWRRGKCPPLCQTVPVRRVRIVRRGQASRDIEYSEVEMPCA